MIKSEGRRTYLSHMMCQLYAPVRVEKADITYGTRITLTNVK
jgi:hypothetical protein